ncbi:PEGA domain-containing protein [Anaerobacillus alkaliphilus]|uniref:PEGA domain-containing protein n=1 Tax=Anaerobacillus alkaliphilus TaxID=1548597 RepID=A0A4Q0VP44_9BACI|nr:carboxypeptidase regulatory-like domain-containing protein [Anaerobacillus alkaliphilus]RXI97889.1 PEGA domain-containing protein [Anaerobacillus alkaliphilus]
MGQRRWKKQRKWFSLFFIFLLLVSSFLPQISYANELMETGELLTNELDIEREREKEFAAPFEDTEATDELASLLSGLGWEAPTLGSDMDLELEKETVEPAVLEELQKTETVDVIIRLNQKEDLEQLHKEVSKKSKREDRIKTVKGKLQQRAAASQKALSEALSALEEKGKVKQKESLWVINAITATVDQEALELLQQHEDVERITLDQVIELPEIKIEESKPRLPEWGLEKIYATKVWGDYGLKGKGIVVGIMDTGVDGSHEALMHNYRGRDGKHQYSWIDLSGNNYATPGDGHGHGTHVAGTAVGGGKGEPIGVAPEAEWIAAKIFSDGGSTTLSAIHRAFEWFIAPGGDPSKAPHVVNNSWGNANTYNLEFYEDVQAWVSAGIFPLFSAGNEGPGSQTIGSPGSFPDSFAIGATDKNDQVASFSSRGPVFWADESGNQQRLIKPDVSAPGHQIYSAWPSVRGQGKYHTISGTSMAAPHVSGAIALIYQANPNLTIDEVKTLLKETARTESFMGNVPNDVYGHGIINVYQAVTQAAYAGRVSGTIRTSDGAEVQAKVSVPSQNMQVSTSNGEFQLSIREGKHTVKLEAFGYKTLEAEVTVTKGQTTEVSLLLQASSRYSVTGKVVEEGTDHGVAFAYIRVKGTPLTSVRTNELGEFAIQAVPAGTYEMVVSGEGIKGRTETINVNENKEVELAIQKDETNTERDWATANNNNSRNAVSSNAIDVESLTSNWQYSSSAKGQILFSTPSVAENVIVFTTDRGWITALNRTTGVERWSVRLGATNRSTPTIANGVVYLSGGQDGNIYALDLQSGRVRWTKGIGQPAIYESPIYKDGVLFVGSGLVDNPSVFALNAENGDTIWSKSLGGSSFFGATLGEDLLYIGSYDNRKLHALELSTGSERWSITVPQEGFASRPVFHEGNIYVVSANFNNQAGTLHAINGNNGELIWRVAGVGDTQAGSPVVFEDIVIVNSAAQPILRGFNKATGEVVWTNRSVGTAVHNGSVTANGILFYANTSGSFYAIDVYSGNILKEFSLPDYSTSGIPVVPGNVLVAHRSGIVSYQSPGVVEGRVIDSNGKPLEVSVSVMETGERVMSNSTGDYSLPHEPGKYSVKVSHYGKKQVIEEVTFVSGYKERRNYQLEEAEEGSLQLSIKDARTKEPLFGVEVLVKETPLNGATNDNGELQFGAVYEGTYEIEIALNGYEVTKRTVTIEAGKTAVLSMELSPFDIAVLNDWNSEVTSLLNMNGFLAEERGWDIIEDIFRYDIVYLNGAYGSGGWKPDRALFNTLIEKAKEHDVSLIFADAWGANYGSIRQLTEFKQDPKEIAHHYGLTGQVRLQVDQAHPIFEGFEVGDRVTLYTRTGDFAWFNQYSGRSIATIGSTTQGMVGTGVAYKAVSENSAHLLLGSHAAAPWISPLQGWLSDMQTILFNGIDYLQEASFGEVVGTIVDDEGNPVEAEIAIVETNNTTKASVIDGRSSFQFFHDEGTYTLEVRASGFTTQTEEVTIQHGSPIEVQIVMGSSNGDRVAGIVTDGLTQQPAQAAIVTMEKDGEVLAELTTAANGRFEFTGLEYGTYTLKVKKDGYIQLIQQVQVGRMQEELQLEIFPTPKVAVFGEYNSNGRNFQAAMQEVGVEATSLTLTNVVDEVGNFDVLFINDVPTSSFTKVLFDNLLAAADAAQTSIIFGDTYYTGSGINHLVRHRQDPRVRNTILETTKAAGYIVLEEHPIFRGFNEGDFVELLLPTASRVGYFSEYSGYSLATITHEGNEHSLGLGVAYKPRTSNSLELLMSGHGFGLGHHNEHYTVQGKQVLTNAIVWAAYTSFHTISGQVTDESGNPLLAEISVVGEPFSTTTDPETGEFTIAIKDGNYQILIDSFGYQSRQIQVQVDANMEPLNIELEVDTTVGSIRGLVENEKDGTAIGNVSVEVIGVPRTSTTSAQGSFSIERLMPGNYQLLLTREGFVNKKVEIEVGTNEEVAISLTMKPSPTIGVIVDSTASGTVKMKDYLEDRGYRVIDMSYTDLELLQEVDLVIANSDYDNNRIPTRNVFHAFQQALDTTETSVIWTGQHGGRGSIRYLYEYENNPSIEIRGSKAGMQGTVNVEHPILEGIPSAYSLLASSNYYYAFDGYDGTTISDVTHPTDGRIGSAIAYRGRTLHSLEVLLANFTFSNSFHPGNPSFFDKERETIFNNAITWALDNEEPLVGELYGQVENNQGIAVKATITVNETGKQIETDHLGAFRLGLPEGTYTLGINVFGHHPESFTVTMTNGEKQEETFIVTADRAGVITGTVLHAQNEAPIAGAVVAIMGTPITAVTDENGVYQVVVPVGEYDVRASASGYTSTIHRNVSVIENEEVNVNFLLEESEKVAVVATSTNGNRLMTFLTSRGYEAELHVNSNLDNLRETMAEYAVILFNEKHSSMTKDAFEQFLQLAQENGVSIIFGSQFNGGTIRDLSDFTGNPQNVSWSYVPGHVNVKVVHSHPIFAGFTSNEIPLLNNGTSNQQYAVYSSYSGTTIGSLSHNDQGILGDGIGYEFKSANSVHILLSGLQVGTYGHPESRWTDEAKQLYTNAIDWAISASLGEITGVVTTEDGKSISNATVFIPSLGLETKTNVAGQYRLGVGTGMYELKVVARGYEEQTQTVNVSQLGETVEANFELTKVNGVMISGTIKKKSEVGIAGAIVTLRDVGTNTILDEIVTNDVGYYEFADLLDGEYEVSVEVDGYLPTSERVLIEGEDIILNLSLQSIQVAVIGDWNDKLSTFLNEQELFAEARDWDLVEEVEKYQLIVINTNKGTKEQLKALINAADEHQVSLVFVGTWGVEEGSISLLEKTVGYPTLDQQGYNEGEVMLPITDHPIFEGLGNGFGNIVIHASKSPYSTFKDYPGKVVGNILVGGVDKGASIAYAFMGERHMHLLLSSFAVTNIIGPNYGWTEDGKQLFVQALRFAMEAERPEEPMEPELPSIPQWNEKQIRTSESLVEVTGHGEVGSIIHIYEMKGNKKELLLSTVVNEDGTFSIQLEFIKNGNYFLYAQAENETGLSEWSESLQIVKTGKPK